MLRSTLLMNTWPFCSCEQKDWNQCFLSLQCDKRPRACIWCFILKLSRCCQPYDSISINSPVFMLNVLHLNVSISCLFSPPRGRALMVVLGVWVVASLISFMPIHLKLWVSNDSKAKQCLENELCCDFNTNVEYAVSSSIVSFYLPLVVMIFLYSRVFQEAQKQLEKIRGRERHFNHLHYNTQPTYQDDKAAVGELRAEEGETGEDSSNMERSGGTDAPKEKVAGKHSATKRHKFCLKEHKAVKTLGIIMGTFTLCWLPFFILNILMTFLDLGNITVLFRLLNWLGYSNSAFNPLIYCRSPDFRHAFQEILCLRGKGGRRWGWCRERDCYSKPLGTMNKHSALNGDVQGTSVWKGSLENSVPDCKTLTVASLSPHCEKALDVAPGSLTCWQANGSAKENCQQNLASHAWPMKMFDFGWVYKAKQ